MLLHIWIPFWFTLYSQRPRYSTLCDDVCYVFLTKHFICKLRKVKSTNLIALVEYIYKLFG